MSESDDWNARIIAEFRANKGEVAAPYDNPPPMILLHTIGAKSGTLHVVPMRCLVDGNDLYVFASAHGQVRNPDWYYNLKAHPDIVIEKGTEILQVRASELVGDEREQIFARQVALFPIFGQYQQELERQIPVFRLSRCEKQNA
jgi:deazaflavin-dependent oxidoreductase (nitroreductase family)